MICDQNGDPLRIGDVMAYDYEDRVRCAVVRELTPTRAAGDWFKPPNMTPYSIGGWMSPGSVFKVCPHCFKSKWHHSSRGWCLFSSTRWEGLAP